MTVFKQWTLVRSSLAAAVLAMASLANAAAPAPNDTCFSPQEDCNTKLIAFIESAQSTVDIAIYNVTLRELPPVLQAAQARGVKIRMVVDRSEASSKGSLVSDMNNAGLALKFGAAQGIMHDKFTIVDGRMIETGSYNYTWAATKYNAENQIYLDTPQIVNRYKAEFESLWSAGTPVPPGFTPEKPAPGGGHGPAPAPVAPNAPVAP